MANPEFQILFKEAIAEAKAIQKAGAAASHEQRAHAQQLLLQVIEQDQANIPAWLWLSTVVLDIEEKQLCLENVLFLEPDNQPARNGLARLKGQKSPSAPRPSTPQTTAGTKAPPGPKITPSQQLCPFCQQGVSPMDTICQHCDIPLIIDCPACERRVDIEEKYCPCGQILGNFREGADYFAQLATAYQRHQRMEKALAGWKIVARLRPDYPHVLLRIGEIEAIAGRTDAAISIMQQALKNPGDEQLAALALGRILQDLGQWDEAEMLYRRGLSIAPDNGETHFAMGWYKMERGELQGALSHLNKAVDLAPHHAQAWLRLAQLQEHLKNPKQSARAYQQALNFLPKDGLDSLKVQRKLQQLQPALPSTLATNWGEFLRQMSGPVLICIVAALLDAGLRPWWIPLTGWLAILLSIVGTFLWVSGDSLPRNPVLTFILGPKAFASEEVRFTAASLGVTFWLIALVLILWPIGQTFPEVPPL